jgi:uncharacterized protein YjbI with pentapeptide repeats
MKKFALIMCALFVIGLFFAPDEESEIVTAVVKTTLPPCSSFSALPGKVRTVAGHQIFPGADLYEVDLAAKDLSYARLSGANLMGSYNYMANFHGADLSKSSLQGSDLHYANFFLANLCGADLSYSKLDNADFRYADLRGASFKNAEMFGTDLRGANLAGADFTGAVIRYFSFEKHKSDLEDPRIDVNLQGTIMPNGDVHP